MTTLNAVAYQGVTTVQMLHMGSDKEEGGVAMLHTSSDALLLEHTTPSPHLHARSASHTQSLKKPQAFNQWWLY